MLRGRGRGWLLALLSLTAQEAVCLPYQGLENGSVPPGHS